MEEAAGDTTRQLKLGPDRARQRTDLEMLDGAEVIRAVEPVGVDSGQAGAAQQLKL